MAASCFLSQIPQVHGDSSNHEESPATYERTFHLAKSQSALSSALMLSTTCRTSTEHEYLPMHTACPRICFRNTRCNSLLEPHSQSEAFSVDLWSYPHLIDFQAPRKPLPGSIRSSCIIRNRRFSVHVACRSYSARPLLILCAVVRQPYSPQGVHHTCDFENQKKEAVLYR